MGLSYFPFTSCFPARARGLVLCWVSINHEIIGLACVRGQWEAEDAVGGRRVGGNRRVGGGWMGRERVCWEGVERREGRRGKEGELEGGKEGGREGSVCGERVWWMVVERRGWEGTVWWEGR